MTRTHSRGTRPAGKHPPPTHAAGARGPRPRKALGQHFLRDSGVLADIVAAVGPPGDPVVEIGAGTGELTAALLEAGHDLVAIEVEPRMIRHLKGRFGPHARLRIVEGDARDIDLAALVDPAPSYRVVGNLPYFAASFITRRALENPRPPRSMVVMVQREVAREFAAKPGKLSLLALAIQVYAEPTVLFDVPPEAFDPPPAVWSSVIRLEMRASPVVPVAELGAFFDFVSRVFRSPRKQIHNGLGLPKVEADEVLTTAGIEPSRRPETLSIGEWRALLTACKRERNE